MPYEYDRFEREDGGGSFLMGLLAGTVLGAGLGMLFAPKAGTDLRTQLSEQAGKLKTTANDTYQQASGKVSQMVDRGREAYERARGSAGQVGEDLSEAAASAASAVKTAGENMSRPTGPTSVPSAANRF